MVKDDLLRCFGLVFRDESHCSVSLIISYVIPMILKLALFSYIQQNQINYYIRYTNLFLIYSIHNDIYEHKLKD